MATDLGCELIPLRFLAVGERARIGQLLGRPQDRQRLEELGLRQGVMLEMIQSGSPCIIRFNGGKFCLRDDDSFGVLVELGSRS